MNDVQKLTEAFISEVRADSDLAPHLKEIDRRNKAAQFGCATHDFCDANMVMLAAFQSAFGREMDFDSQPDCDLTNAAWDAAIKEGFSSKA